jgi:hypothetical protein
MFMKRRVVKLQEKRHYQRIMFWLKVLIVIGWIVGFGSHRIHF